MMTMSLSGTMTTKTDNVINKNSKETGNVPGFFIVYPYSTSKLWGEVLVNLKEKVMEDVFKRLNANIAKLPPDRQEKWKLLAGTLCKSYREAKASGRPVSDAKVAQMAATLARHVDTVHKG